MRLNVKDRCNVLKCTREDFDLCQSWFILFMGFRVWRLWYTFSLLLVSRMSQDMSVNFVCSCSDQTVRRLSPSACNSFMETRSLVACYSSCWYTKLARRNVLYKKVFWIDPYSVTDAFLFTFPAFRSVNWFDDQIRLDLNNGIIRTRFEYIGYWRLISIVSVVRKSLNQQNS